MKLFVEIISVLLITYCSARPLRDNDWDHFVFALGWPQSLCWELDITSGEKCDLPTETNSWTIHGLWPSGETSQGPEFCTKDKFDKNLISTIENNLDINWPNLLPNTGKYSFWKHEWEKHGTCAMSMEELNSELKYFSKALEIHQTYDILGILKKAGIEPSETAYQFDDYSGAIDQALGTKARLQCYNPKSEPVQYLGQIEFCLDTSFQLMECPQRQLSSENRSGPTFHTLKRDSKNGLVWKMEISDKETSNLNLTPAVDGNFNHKLNLNDCSQNKGIMYPIINHDLNN